MNKMSTHTARNKKPRIPLSGHGAVLLLLFAIMIESKRRLLEVFSNLADASGQLLVLQAAGVAPSGEVLVELGVVDAGPLGNLLGVEAVEVVEKRTDVVLELESVVGKRLAFAFIFLAHQLARFQEAGNGFFGRASHPVCPEVLFIVIDVATEGAVYSHLDNHRELFFSFHNNYRINKHVAISPETTQTKHSSRRADVPGHGSLSEQPASEFSFKPPREFLGVMPWHGFLVTRYGTEPNIVFASMANQAATCLLEFLYELFRFHNFKELINNTAKLYNNITSAKHKAIFLYGSKDI